MEIHIGIEIAGREYVALLDLDRPSRGKLDFTTAADEQPRAVIKVFLLKGGLNRRTYTAASEKRRSSLALREWDRRFTVNERCTSCGICERICPVDNICMEGLHPSRLRRCESCLVCLHFCPVEAIQFGKRTRGKRRCTHSV